MILIGKAIWGFLWIVILIDALLFLMGLPLAIILSIL